MNRTFKTVCTTMVAALALSAGASSASAEFHSEVAHTIFSGSQEGTGTFTVDPGTIHCKKATVSGTATTATTNSVTVTPRLEECTLTSIFGNIAVTVNMNECDAIITTNGEGHSICPVGKSVTVSGPGCTITVPGGQTLLGGTFTNIGSGSTREIRGHGNVTGIKYSYSGFTCGSGSGTENGTSTGTGVITATNTEGAHVGIWHQI